MHKPHPEPLLYYAFKTNTRPSSCIYIGDMPTDVASANAAGFASVLVCWNKKTAPNNGAEYIFTSPEELLNLYQC